VKLIVYVAILVLLLSFASATVSIEESAVTLKVDYSDFTDGDQDTIAVTTEQFTLSSDEAITVTLSADLPSNYGLEEKDITLAAGEEKSVSLVIQVPHRQDGGIKNIGQIKVTDSSDNVLNSVSLKQETKSMLEFNRLSVSYVNTDEKNKKDRFNGADEQYVLEDDVRPNTEITLEFELRNLFDNDYDDLMLEDVELHIEADDNDLLPDDFKEDYSLGNIKAEGKIVETVKFILNPDADSTTYTLEFTVEAQDERGYNYEISKELELNIDLLKHDVRITKAEIYPVDTCDSSLILDLTLRNFGSYDQDYVAVKIYNQELGLNQDVRNIALEENSYDDTWSQSLNFGSLKLAAKTYSLDITAYIDNNKAIDIERLDFTVNSCQTSSDEVNKEDENSPEENEGKTEDDQPLDNNIDQSESAKDQSEKIGSSKIISSIEDPYTDDDYLVSIMVVGIIMTLAIIGMFTFILVKKK